MNELDYEDFKIVFSYLLNRKLSHCRIDGHRMTQRDLANATGLDKSEISNYVCGNRLPTLYKFHLIIQALGCSADDLLIFDEDTVDRAFYIHNCM